MWRHTRRCWRLANTSAALEDQGVFLLDVVLSGDQRAVQMLVAALKQMDKGERCMALLDARCEADAPRRRSPCRSDRDG